MIVCLHVETPKLSKQNQGPFFFDIKQTRVFFCLFYVYVYDQAKKDADVKRLSELFNSSPSEDDDSDASPEDDLGDGRELLP